MSAGLSCVANRARFVCPAWFGLVPAHRIVVLGGFLFQTLALATVANLGGNELCEALLPVGCCCCCFCYYSCCCRFCGPGSSTAAGLASRVLVQLTSED